MTNPRSSRLCGRYMRPFSIFTEAISSVRLLWRVGAKACYQRQKFRQKVMALEASLPKTKHGENSANAYVNWLKHGRFKTGGARIEATTISDLEVIYTIWRAISKFQAAYGNTAADRTLQMLSFENCVGTLQV